MKGISRVIILSIGLIASVRAYGQDSSVLIQNKADKYLKSVNEKTVDFNRKIERFTSKALKRVLRQEQKMKKKLLKTDSLLAAKLFPYSIDSLQKLQKFFNNQTDKVKRPSDVNYFPYLDTLTQSLAFLEKSEHLFEGINANKKYVTDVIVKVKVMEKNMEGVKKVQEFLKDRKAILKANLKNFPALSKYIKRVNKEVYYYTAQINEYKTILSDQAKIEQLVLSAIRELPAFKKLMSDNSQLSGLFGMTTIPSFSSGSNAVVNGIQPRAAVQQAIQTSLGGSGSNVSQMVTQQLGQAQATVEKLRNKLNELGAMDDNEVPDFKPKNLRTKSFWKRAEYGFDMQFSKANNLLPSSGNIAFMLGYKLSERNNIGFGIGYRSGFGKSWNNLSLTHEGISLRTYANWRIKGGIYLQGGSEWNYNSRFRRIQQLKDVSMWEHSALLGISKKYNVSKKLKGNIQVLYDFLHKQHVNAQPVLFRIGFGF
ncbi:MAG: hypothetical protein SFU87_16105 [Chitinophagaceae bacterium]|nr:hypothetical protein [Chitinophagaceae bacterium]